MSPIRSLLLCAAICSLLLTACTRQPLPPPMLPTGMQTMTGTLLPAEISTLRRGSHLLTSAGQRLCFVESTTVNLRSFEGKEVVIRGIFEPNSDPALLPVLVTQDVTAVQQETTPLSLPAFGLHGIIPRSWITATQGNTVILLLEGTTTPLVRVTRQEQTSLPATGVPFLIAGHYAVRQTSSDTQEEVISIEREDGLIVLTFTPAEDSNDPDLLRAQWNRLLTSLSFTQPAGTQSSSADAAASATGQPCGGTAGILCPAGQYCAITDMAENIGRCRSIGGL